MEKHATHALLDGVERWEGMRSTSLSDKASPNRTIGSGLQFSFTVARSTSDNNPDV